MGQQYRPMHDLNNQRLPPDKFFFFGELRLNRLDYVLKRWGRGGQGREGEGDLPVAEQAIEKTAENLAPQKPRAVYLSSLLRIFGKLEARVGIEPTYTDLQSAASPLCHRATVPVSGITSPAREVT